MQWIIRLVVLLWLAWFSFYLITHDKKFEYKTIKFESGNISREGIGSATSEPIVIGLIVAICILVWVIVANYGLFFNKCDNLCLMFKENIHWSV